MSAAFSKPEEVILKVIPQFSAAVTKSNRTTFIREGKIVTLNRAEDCCTRGLPQIGRVLLPVSLVKRVDPTVICSPLQLSVCPGERTLGILVATSTLVVLK